MKSLYKLLPIYPTLISNKNCHVISIISPFKIYDLSRSYQTSTVMSTCNTGIQRLNMTPNQPIYILGSGSIACLLACHLAHRNCPVVMLDRSLKLTCHNKEFTTKTIQYTPLFTDNSMSSLSSTTYSVSVQRITMNGPVIENLVVATKASDLLPALEPFRSRIIPGRTAVVITQNGYGQHLQPMILDIVGSNHYDAMLGWASTSHGAYLRSPSSHLINDINPIWKEVIHAGNGKWIFGPVSITSPSIKKLITLDTNPSVGTFLQYLAYCLSANNQVTLLNDSVSMDAQLLRKLVVNACINAPSAIAYTQNGGLLDPNTPWPSIIKKLAYECAHVLIKAKYDAIHLAGCETGDKIYHLVKEVCQTTSKNYSSTPMHDQVYAQVCQLV